MKKTENIEKRAEGDIAVKEDVVQGYAAVFNKEASICGYVETIEPGAITDETILRSDVFAVLDHDNRRGVLARSKKGNGSLLLKVDSKGLFYSFPTPDTAIGKELRSHIERGEIDGSSFAFTVLKDEWEKKGDIYHRKIKDIDLIFDVSPVFSPVYDDTTVALRSLEAFKESEASALKKLADEAEAEKRKKEEELEAYYMELEYTINN